MARRSTDSHRDFLVRLGHNVRRERTARAITQERLAELADLHPRMIPKIESGETNLLITTVARLQAALDCPWVQLVPAVRIVAQPLRGESKK